MHNKWLKRLKVYQIGFEDRYTTGLSLQKQAKPCSCFMCSYDKFNRKIKHKNKFFTREELKTVLKLNVK